MSLLLASVANLKEVERVAQLMPPHIVDFKTGAFDSWEPLALQTAIGLLPNLLKSGVVGAFEEPEKANRAMAGFLEVGLDYVKVGLTHPSPAKIRALADGSMVANAANAANTPQKVLVLFAEQYSYKPSYKSSHNSSSKSSCEPDIFSAAKSAGFSVIMLDTLNKEGANLAKVLTTKQILEFIQAAHQNKLKCGLAGGLNTTLTKRYLNLKVKPDILGFRGALCSDKRQNLCPNKTHQLGLLFPSQANANAAALQFNSDAWGIDEADFPNNDSICHW